MAYFRNDPFTGIVYSLHNSNDTAYTFSYANGYEDGVHTKWFTDRKLAEVRTWKQGKKHGPQNAWWDNGQKQFSFVAENDMYTGNYREWTREGALIKDFNYVNGQEEGSQRLYNPDGSIRSNYVITNGRRYGLLGTKNCINVKDSVLAD
jgi:antitoxin component YwqK of YwqJK toxin-antitoxin module